MEGFDLTALGATFGALVAILATVVQFAKVQLGLKGDVVRWLSLGLGLALGVTGLEEAGRQVLPLLPGWASGGVLGLLAGIVASGSKDLITGIQINGAQARARAEATVALDVQQDQAADWRAATAQDVLQGVAPLAALPAGGLSDLIGEVLRGAGLPVTRERLMQVAVALAPVAPDLLLDGSAYLSSDSRNRILKVVMDLRDGGQL